MYKISQKLSDIILHDHQLLPVINRFGIRLGFGDQSVAEVCKEHGVNAEFLIEILNIYHDPEYFPRERIQEFPLPLIVEYLKKTHQYYYTYYIPEIEKQFNELLASAPEQNNLSILTKFYLKFKQELHDHLQYEDKNTFPYILRLHDQFQHGKTADAADAHLPKSIIEFEEEHNDVDNKILDLKNIIIKYLKAGYDDNICNTLLSTLFLFEDDLRDHARIEDKILVPKVLQIEKTISGLWTFE